ncbi:MAG: MBG domain-containing protein, partial [bacterium]|nr:MBG domain-containing protein [bacterium]
AVANTGYHFVRWMRAGAQYSTANSLTVTNVTADMTLTAEFEPTVAQIITFTQPPPKTYGDATFDLTPTPTASSGLPVTVVSDNAAVATVSGSTVTLHGAGTCTLTASQTGDADWSPAANMVRALTVAKAALSITADGKSRPYGDPNPAFTLSYTGFVAGDAAGDLDTAPAATCAATATSPVGAYPIAPAGGADANYALSYVNGTLTINRAPLTCTADDKSRAYGSANPPLTITYAGLKNGATAPATPPVSACAATTNSPVGPYPITLTGGSDPNYSLALVNGTLTVVQANQTITFANPGDKVYTDNVALSATGGGSGNPVTFAVSAGPALIGAGNTLSFTGVGAVTITASQAGDANWNAAPDVSRAFTVGRGTPTLTWPTPAAITQGTALGDAQLNATANAAGMVAQAVPLIAVGVCGLEHQFEEPDPAAPALLRRLDDRCLEQLFRARMVR